MNNNVPTYFDIPKGGYAAFDAMSLRQIIIDRLNQQGTFTDQNYIGSNLSTIIDIISYTFHTLIFYLNKTSSESMFTEAQLYENINRIVKLIDYSPIGAQTSTLTFSCSAGSLPQGTYTLPRYAYLVADGVPFSFNEDITFTKLTNTVEFLKEISEQKLLYQGIFQEYPLYTATGEDNELIILNTGEEIVDHFNIDIYVKPKLKNKWEQFYRTPNLILERSIANKCEIRLNSNKRYEIKFGNDINGYKLQPGDLVQIYYLNSAGSSGEVSAGALTRGVSYSAPTLPGTPRYQEIINDLLGNEFRLLDRSSAENIFVTNSTGSTTFESLETPDQIRENAPSTYKSQYRLVTIEDYVSYIKSNFANIIYDVRVFNNWEYVSEYLKYFYDIGLTNPDKTERALFNQVNFADSCNFNNVYLTVVPRSETQEYKYLLPAQKQFISDQLLDKKTLTTEIMFTDPIYMAISLGILESNELQEFNPNDIESISQLEIVKAPGSRRDNQSIISEINSIFLNYFLQKNVKIGQTVDVLTLVQQILNVDGVNKIFTTRTDNPLLRYEGLSLLAWNPLYSEKDKQFFTNNLPLNSFQFPYFYDINSLSTKIKVVTPPNVFSSTEY